MQTVPPVRLIGNTILKILATYLFQNVAAWRWGCRRCFRQYWWCLCTLRGWSWTFQHNTAHSWSCMDASIFQCIWLHPRKCIPLAILPICISIKKTLAYVKLDLSDMPHTSIYSWFIFTCTFILFCAYLYTFRILSTLLLHMCMLSLHVKCSICMHKW